MTDNVTTTVGKPSLTLKYDDGVKMYDYSIPESTLDGEKQDEWKNTYCFTVPKDLLRKNTEQNELYYQMKAYTDTCPESGNGLSLSSVVSCYNAEQDLICTYNSDDVLNVTGNNSLGSDTSVSKDTPLELVFNDGSCMIPCKMNTYLKVLNESVNIPRGGYLYVGLYNGADKPLHDEEITVTFKWKNEDDTVYKATTNKEGVARLQINFTTDALKKSPTGTSSQRAYISYTGRTQEINDGYKRNDDGTVTLNSKNETVYYKAETINYKFYIYDKRETKIVLDTSHNSTDTKNKTITAVNGTTLTARVKDVKTGDYIPNAHINLYINKKKQSKVTNGFGDAFFTTNISKGTYTLTANFNGDDYYKPCSLTDYNKIQIIQGINKNKVRGKEVELYYEFSSDYNTITKNTTVYTFNKGKNILCKLCLKENHASIYNTKVSIKIYKDDDKFTEYTATTDGNGYFSIPTKDITSDKVKCDIGNISNKYLQNTGYLTVYFKFNEKSTTQILLKSNTHIVPEDNLVYRLITNENNPIVGQTVYVQIDNGKAKAYKTDKYGTFKVGGFSTGKHKVKVYVKKMNDHNLSLPKQYTVNITIESLPNLANSMINYKPNRSLVYLHLRLPLNSEDGVESVNDDTEYLRFQFRIHPTLTEETITNTKETTNTDGTTTKETITEKTGNYKIESSHVYFKDFMVNYGNTLAQYDDTKRAYTPINFTNTYYTLLYPSNDTTKGLQVIRPNKDTINTKNILKSNKTVFAPFYNPDIKEDRPENIVLEYLNFHSQNIKITQE